jgi:hypothetical protein
VAEQFKSPKALVVIPAFNEEKTITDVARAAGKAHNNIDVLVINDDSTDNTKTVLKVNGIEHIDLPLNLGIGGAVQTGFLYALEHDYDIAIQVDGDGQHPPEQIPALIESLSNGGVDFVVGSRYLKNNQIVSTWARRIGGGVLAAMIYLSTGKKITDPTSGFRAFNRRALEFLCQYYPQEYPEPISNIELLENGFNLVEIPVIMKTRKFGNSSITGPNILFYMIKVIFSIIIVKLRRRQKK